MCGFASNFHGFSEGARNTSVIRVGVVYVNICISRCLKEELAWAIDKWLQLIINTMLFKTVISLRI